MICFFKFFAHEESPGKKVVGSVSASMRALLQTTKCGGSKEREVSKMQCSGPWKCGFNAYSAATAKAGDQQDMKNGITSCPNPCVFELCQA